MTWRFFAEPFSAGEEPLAIYSFRFALRGEMRYSKAVGKTFHFECPLCQYRAKVSGGADAGLHCAVQTVLCRDCRELLDVFTRRRHAAGADAKNKFPGFFRPEIPPTVLRDGKKTRLVWQEFAPACPHEPKHFVEVWKDPGRCPRCGCYMEKQGLAFRVWD
jgi:hypothetical protein